MFILSTSIGTRSSRVRAPSFSGSFCLTTVKTPRDFSSFIFTPHVFFPVQPFVSLRNIVQCFSSLGLSIYHAWLFFAVSVPSWSSPAESVRVIWLLNIFTGTPCFLLFLFRDVRTDPPLELPAASCRKRSSSAFRVVCPCSSF